APRDRVHPGPGAHGLRLLPPGPSPGRAGLHSLGEPPSQPRDAGLARAELPGAKSPLRDQMATLELTGRSLVVVLIGLATFGPLGACAPSSSADEEARSEPSEVGAYSDTG